MAARWGAGDRLGSQASQGGGTEGRCSARPGACCRNRRNAGGTSQALWGAHLSAPWQLCLQKRLSDCRDDGASQGAEGVSVSELLAVPRPQRLSAV